MTIFPKSLNSGPYILCMKNKLHKPDLSGRVSKLPVKLSEHNISYQPCTTLKSHVITNFIADFTPNPLIEAGNELMVL